MDNENNTKIIRYLDGGDVCGFIFFIISVVGVGSGSGGGIHLVDHSTEILPLLGCHLPARPHNIPLLLGLIVAVGGIHHLDRRILQRSDVGLRGGGAAGTGGIDYSRGGGLPPTPPAAPIIALPRRVWSQAASRVSEQAIEQAEGHRVRRSLYFGPFRPGSVRCDSFFLFVCKSAPPPPPRFLQRDLTP